MKPINIQVKDHMESAWDLQLFFDLDNLKQITSESREVFSLIVTTYPLGA